MYLHEYMCMHVYMHVYMYMHVYIPGAKAKLENILV